LQEFRTVIERDDAKRLLRVGAYVAEVVRAVDPERLDRRLVCAA